MPLFQGYITYKNYYNQCTEAFLKMRLVLDMFRCVMRKKDATTDDEKMKMLATSDDSKADRIERVDRKNTYVFCYGMPHDVHTA